MKALTVDFVCITQSMRDVSREHNDYFLDRSTGKVISLSRDLIRSLTREPIERVEESLPEWDAQMIPLARKIILSASREFVRIPEAYGRPEHEWRLAFTETVQSEKLKEKLNVALKGRGSCHRFKAILEEYPHEKLNWETFYHECWKDKVTQWLESVGILAFEGKNNLNLKAS